MNLLSNRNEAQYHRHNMVVEQLQYRGIQHPAILRAFEEVPRHLFVPNVSLRRAYDDNPLPIQAGQTISQPYIVALMLTYLEPRPELEVLEIGSGSGYATALLSKLCRHVSAVEVYAELLDASQLIIDQLNIKNVSFIHRSAWEQKAFIKVYHRIILWASPPRIPEHLFDLLDEEGILVAPEGKRNQYVWVYKKHSGSIDKIRRDAVRFVPLVQGTVSEIDHTQRG